MSLRKVQILRAICGIVCFVLVIANHIVGNSGSETVQGILLVATVIALAAFLFLISQWKCPACKKPLPLRHRGGEYCPHCGEYLFYEE